MPARADSDWIQHGDDGTWLLPAFSDRHCHPLFAARELSSLQLTPNLRPSDAVLELKRHVDSLPNLDWLDATAFNQDLNETFSAQQLDEVSLVVPVVVHSADRHNLWVNTAALNAAGLLDLVPELKDAEVVVNDQGRPTGILHEWSAMQLVLNHQPLPSPSEDLNSLILADQTLSASGYVGISDAWIDPGMFEVYQAAMEASQLKSQYELWFRVSSDDKRSQLDYLAQSLLALRSSTTQTAKSNVKISGVKVFLDGVISSKTASIVGGYDDGSAHETLWSAQQLQELLVSVAEIDPKLRPHFHAIGDAAVSLALDAVEHARRSGLWVGTHRPVVAHAELVLEEDLVRLRNLDVEVVVSPQWLAASAEADSSAEALPCAKRLLLGDFSRYLSAGIFVTCGSDWPVSAPDPMFAIATGLEWLRRKHNDSQVVKEMPFDVEHAMKNLWQMASGPAWKTSKAKLAFRENPMDVAMNEPERLSGLKFELL
jgi:predicted amidohydrolase YtcJ